MSSPTPLFELFLDLPHPEASQECPGAFLIPAPHASQQNNLLATPEQVTRFAFPDIIVNPNHNTITKTRLNQHDVYANSTSRLESFTFSWQTDTGSRLHGHVRRYLPPHLTSRTRYDVGRRGERALVILTYHITGLPLFASILKTIQAISAQQVAVSETIHNGNPQQWFLYQLYELQQSRTKLAQISNLELDEPENYGNIDVHKYHFPASMISTERTQSHNAAIMPLLRCVGISNGLRILSALLSEARIIFCSRSTVRLTQCLHAVLSLLETGGLSWQHIYIPVLSIHLHTILAAPYPYVIGILDERMLQQTYDAVGEILYVQLDANVLETRNIPEHVVHERLPDLVVSTHPDVPSPIEPLIQQLLDILKLDKKLSYGDSNVVGETAQKAKEVLKKSFFKLRDRFRDANTTEEAEAETANQASSEDSMAADYIYTEGCHNEISEQEVRIAFTIFFLTFHGDVRWFLTKQPNGEIALDAKRFVHSKQSYGPSNLLQLAQNFGQTQLFQEYSKARIAAIGSQKAVGVEGSLFLQCEQYLRQKHLDFGIATVQRIARHVADSSPIRLTGMPQTNARQTAMNLTSSKATDSPETNRMIAQLVEQSRECSSVLTDVMSVIWARLRDCKGLQWKHGLLALQLLRNLLYHGPLAAISEANDGLSKIRSLKFYENIRSQCAQQIQAAAASVYNLLVDRAKLFAVRRVCADRRRKFQQPDPQRRRQQNAHLGVPFRQLHALMHPNASSGTIVQLPPKSQIMSRGYSSSNETPPTQTTEGAGDVLDLFGGMSIGSTPKTGASSDFDVFASPPASGTAAPPPTQSLNVPPPQQQFPPQPAVPPQQQQLPPQPSVPVPLQHQQQFPPQTAVTTQQQSWPQQQQLQQQQQQLPVQPVSQQNFMAPQQQMPPQQMPQQQVAPQHNMPQQQSQQQPGSTQPLQIPPSSAHLQGQPFAPQPPPHAPGQPQPYGQPFPPAGIPQQQGLAPNAGRPPHQPSMAFDPFARK